MNLRFTCCIFYYHFIEIWEQVLGFSISKLWIWSLGYLKSRVLRILREEESGICVRV